MTAMCLSQQEKFQDAINKKPAQNPGGLTRKVGNAEN
jgi:hypothetical protein